MPLSIKCWRKRRARGAPSARRTVDSRRRPTARESSRFATFAQTMRSSTPTRSSRIHRALTSPLFSALTPRPPGRVMSVGILAGSPSCLLARQGCGRDSGPPRRRQPRPSPASAGRPDDPPVPIVLAARRARRRLKGDLGRERRVDIGPLPGPQAEEPGGSDTDDASGNVVDPDARADGVPAAGKALRPEPIAHDDHGLRRRRGRHP